MVININFRTKIMTHEQAHFLTDMLFQSYQEFSSTKYVKVCFFYIGSLRSTLAYTYCDLIPLSAASCFHSFNHISNKGLGILVLFFFLFPYNVPSSSMLLSSCVGMGMGMTLRCVIPVCSLMRNSQR